MPALILFKRRWNIGSDDFVVPAFIMIIVHIIWVVLLGVVLELTRRYGGTASLVQCGDIVIHVTVYLATLLFCIAVEICIVYVSTRGSIRRTEPRDSIAYFLYIRIALFVVEVGWQAAGIAWIVQQYEHCSGEPHIFICLGVIAGNVVVLVAVLLGVYCTYDSAGHKWVRMKRFEASVAASAAAEEQQQQQQQQYAQPSRHRRVPHYQPGFWRNWRQRCLSSNDDSYESMEDRVTDQAYSNTWRQRLNFLFCCVRSEEHEDSLTEIAQLFTEFFHEFGDIVPTDIAAGLVLLRRKQSNERKRLTALETSEVFEYLSGVPITQHTRFVSMNDTQSLDEFKTLRHYMHYAMSAYGWPLFIKMNPCCGFCSILPYLKCCACRVPVDTDGDGVIDQDNCCHCHIGAVRRVTKHMDVQYVYVTNHCDVENSPFFIALDHEKQTLVVCLRGTMSLQDLMTDLKARPELLPLDEIRFRDDWFGHRGIIKTAVNIRDKLINGRLLEKALHCDPTRNTSSYKLVLVGHSLGAGSAAILAILLHDQYPDLHCYAYAPPGGLLSETCAIETQSFITSVVVGKDVVPRLGLVQIDKMRSSLLSVIEESVEPKWKILSRSCLCCCSGRRDADVEAQVNVTRSTTLEAAHGGQDDGNAPPAQGLEQAIKEAHNMPLFPPGRIVHIVRTHNDNKGCCRSPHYLYQAVWADFKDFGEILVSPKMVTDHLPENVLAALEQVITNYCPPKPPRRAKSRDDAPCSSNNEGIGVAAAVHTPSSVAPGYAVDSTASLMPDSGMFDETSDTSGLLANTANAWVCAQAAPSETSVESARINGSTNKRYGSASGSITPMRLDLNGPGLACVPSSSDCAPLASPEAMSDTYSVCSRASSVRNSTNYPSGLGGFATDSIAGTLQSRPVPASILRAALAGGSTSAVTQPVNSAVTASSNESQTTEERASTELSTRHDLILSEATVDSSEVDANDSLLPPSINLTDLISKPSPSTDDGSSGTFDVLGTESPSIIAVDSLAACPEYPAGTKEEKVAPSSTLTQSDSGIYCDIATNGSTVYAAPKAEVEYVPCVPDFCNQHLYDDVLGHYSAAGRGYPHGGYMSTSPSANATFPLTHKALPRSVSINSDSVNNNGIIIDSNLSETSNVSKSTHALSLNISENAANTKSESNNSLHTSVTLCITSPQISAD